MNVGSQEQQDSLDYKENRVQKERKGILVKASLVLQALLDPLVHPENLSWRALDMKTLTAMQR